MQKVMQNNCAVFRTGEVLEEGHKLIHDTYRRGVRRARHRPLADLEFRPDRDAGVRQPDRAGGGDHGRGAQPHRKPRRACARGLSRPRRQELDEAHADLDRRQGQREDRLPPGAHLHADQRRRLHRAEGAGVLESWSSSPFRRTPRSPRARPGSARPARATSPRSASTAGTRTTAPTRAWTPISSTATTARRWFSTR